MKFINNNEINNNTYINKDFQALWSELLSLIPKYTNKWNPSQANESDPLAVLIKLLAIFSDKLNYNIDKNILENYPQTLTQERSAYNVYDILGYKAPWYKSAVLDVNFTPNALPPNDITSYTIPRFTMISDENSNVIYTTLFPTEIDFTNVGYTVQTTCIQGTINDFNVNGETLITLNNIDNENRLYFTEKNVAENGIFITSDPEFNLFSTDLTTEWKRVDNIYQTLSNEKSYEFSIDPYSGSCYIQFSDNIANLIGSGIYIKYILSEGSSGNIKQFTLSKFLNDIDVQVSDSNKITLNSYININNIIASASGKNPASIEEMYVNFKRTQNLCNTLVTLLDYEKYIYDYESNIGIPVVSNIRVADRTCDLYDSYTIQTLTKDGEYLDTRIKEGSNFTAFNLRFYPLKSSNNISDEKSFNLSFSYEDETIKKKIDDALILTKAINYDALDIGYPIEISYDLAGQIYLNNKYTKQEKNEVLNNIKTNLYANLNSRELDFGIGADFKYILNLIQNSDERISYVALNPITYNSLINKGPNNTLVNSLTDDSIYARSALAGISPWLKFENTFSYSINQTNNQNWNYTATTDNDNLIITPKVEITLNTIGTDKTFSTRDNETLIIYTPDYKDEITYSNYLYFRTSSNLTWSADKPIKLNSGQNIYFYTTKELAKNNNYQQASYELKGNNDDNNPVIFKASFSFSDDSNDQANNPPSLNNGKSITKLKLNSGDIITNDKTLNVGYKVATNSKKLAEQFSDGNPYTLMTGEYFIFKSNELSGITLLGEGTTLTPNAKITITIPEDLDLTDAIESGNFTNDIWSTVYNTNIQYTINKIYAFGSGYDFILEDTQLNILTDTGTLGKNISYRLTGSNSDYSKLPEILDDQEYKYKLSLDIKAEAYTPVTFIYEANHKQYLDFGEKQLRKGSSRTSQIPDTEITTNNTIIYTQFNHSIISSGAALSLNLETQGIDKFEVMEYLENTESSTVLSDNMWVSIPRQGIKLPGDMPYNGQNTSAVIKISENTIVFILPIYLSKTGSYNLYCYNEDIDNPTNQSTYTPIQFTGTDVKYLAVLPGTRLKLKSDDPSVTDPAGDFKVLKPKVVLMNSTIGNQSLLTLKSIFNNSGGDTTTITASIIDSGFFPNQITDFNLIYEVDKNNMIENPLEPINYFNKNHIFNRYTIAKMNSINGLQIIDN